MSNNSHSFQRNEERIIQLFTPSLKLFFSSISWREGTFDFSLSLHNQLRSLILLRLACAKSSKVYCYWKQLQYLSYLVD